MLNANSIEMLAEQYKDATETNEIVLFIRDEKMKKFKSFIV